MNYIFNQFYNILIDSDKKKSRKKNHNINANAVDRAVLFFQKRTIKPSDGGDEQAVC